MPRAQVLVLEDQELVRDVWVEALEEAGYIVVGLASGAEALNRLPELNPDLILLDIKMPDMDGIQFLARLRTSGAWAHTPVIIVSGIGEQLLKVADRPLADFPQLGVAGILQKPVDVETVIDQVRQVIGAPPRPVRGLISPEGPALRE